MPHRDPQRPCVQQVPDDGVLGIRCIEHASPPYASSLEVTDRSVDVGRIASSGCPPGNSEIPASTAIVYANLITLAGWRKPASSTVDD